MITQKPGETEALLRRALACPADYRVLERLVVPDGETGEGNIADDPNVGVVVDVETVGLAPGDPVIELALRRFRYDADGVITRIDRPYSWLQDPCVPIPPIVTDLTGITDADVAGQIVDANAVERIMTHSTVRIAHHARFDRPRVEALVPAISGQPWACSMSEVDWASRGHQGLKLEALLASIGKFHGAHRAASDVDAVIALLRHRFEDGATALKVMLDRASQPGWIVEATGANYDVKDALRARGYRWDAGRKVWSREIYGNERDPEEWWLAGHVYSGDARPRALGPSWTEIDWMSRHG